MDDTKHPLKSLGIMGPVIALVVFIVNRVKPGIGLTDADLAPVVDAVDVILGTGLGLVGRWRATKQISMSALAALALLAGLALSACTVDQLKLATSEISTGIQAACADVMAASKLPGVDPNVAVYAAPSCGTAQATAGLVQNSATLQWLGGLTEQLKASAPVAASTGPAA